MDSGWELNATVRAKGFEQDEENNKFTVKLSYFADIQTPEGKLLERISSGVVDKTSDEKLIDIPIETQIKTRFYICTWYLQNNFFVKDEATGKKGHLSSFFELSK